MEKTNYVTTKSDDNGGQRHVSDLVPTHSLSRVVLDNNSYKTTVVCLLLLLLLLKTVIITYDLHKCVQTSAQMTIITAMTGLPCGENNYNDMLSHSVQQRNATDRQTDIKTELNYQYRASMCSRAIKTWSMSVVRLSICKHNFCNCKKALSNFDGNWVFIGTTVELLGGI